MNKDYLYTKYKTIYSSRKAHDSAFTLIELLVVLGIISVLFGVGFANFRGYQRKQAIMAAARQVEGDIRLAQEYASQGKKPTATCTGYLNGYLFIVNADNTYDIRADCSGTDETVKDNVAITSGMTLTPTTSMLFKVLGLGTDIPADSPKTIIITSSETGDKVDIVITYSGVVTIDFE